MLVIVVPYLINAFICLRSALNPASLAAVCALVETSRMLTLGCLVINLVTAAIALTRIGSNSSSRAASKCVIWRRQLTTHLAHMDLVQVQQLQAQVEVYHP